jgi:hypothetical protein
MKDQNFGENTGPALVNYATAMVPLDSPKVSLKTGEGFQ